MICANVGVMLSYLTGTFMTYYTSPFVMVLFPIGVFVSFIFIPDTPMSLLGRKKSDKAIENSLKFYLNIKDTTSEYNKTRFDNAMEMVRTWDENRKTQPKLSWKDLSKCFSNSLQSDNPISITF